MSACFSPGILLTPSFEVGVFPHFKTDGMKILPLCTSPHPQNHTLSVSK